jgi:hypothetical protein
MFDSALTLTYAVPLYGVDSPDVLVLVDFTAEARLDLRSARKLVLDHELIQIGMEPRKGPSIKLVKSATPRKANKAVSAMYDDANGLGIAVNETFLACSSPYSNPDLEMVSVVVTPDYAWFTFKSKKSWCSDEFLTMPMNLNDLIGAADADNS